MGHILSALWEPGADDEEQALHSRYADLYRELVALGKTNGIRIVLSTSSMAINASSPRDVKAFYGSVFSPIDDLIAANATHNSMVTRIAAENHVPLIDTQPDLDGEWDDDLSSISSTSPRKATSESQKPCSTDCCLFCAKRRDRPASSNETAVHALERSPPEMNRFFDLAGFIRLRNERICVSN